MTEIEALKPSIHEYRRLLTPGEIDGTDKVDTDRLAEDLARSHDWTDDGAREVISLANQYGAFMLRNALALALALGKEDGDLRF